MLYNKDWDRSEVATEPWRRYLLDAADIIEARGHCHGMVEDAAGRVCIAGAISVVAYGKVERSGRYDFKARMIADLAWYKLEQRVGFVVDWNDQHTGPEVIALLRETALAGDGRTHPISS